MKSLAIHLNTKVGTSNGDDVDFKLIEKNSDKKMLCFV